LEWDEMFRSVSIGFYALCWWFAGCYVAYYLFRDTIIDNRKYIKDLLNILKIYLKP